MSTSLREHGEWHGNGNGSRAAFKKYAQLPPSRKFDESICEVGNRKSERDSYNRSIRMRVSQTRSVPPPP